jgi:hypothetical protein
VAPLVSVTMSLHKLSAGYGYDYLIRQAAALDATHRAGSGQLLQRHLLPGHDIPDVEAVDAGPAW